ncbi:anti-sigma factor [Streptomyces sp. NBC_00878]|uniref:anti-sigma factor family protein n=1 Tax=Streptomyces sp. NBC_00878 TaxID=2975854 RepID=UPI00224D9DF2|nr:zf-HC2 domain-containing protein [Streptomyces sp. NBC_00878]MCX4911135.1 zf-HC2 domain-containing protein [Streptomyces sp. NBC_00878]
MKCEQETSQLAAYVMAALDSEEAEGVRRHLRECPACTAETDDILATLSIVQAVSQEELLGDWADKIPDLREATVRAALEEAGALPSLPPTAAQKRSKARWS